MTDYSRWRLCPVTDGLRVKSDNLQRLKIHKGCDCLSFQVHFFLSNGDTYLGIVSTDRSDLHLLTEKYWSQSITSQLFNCTVNWTVARTGTMAFSGFLNLEGTTVAFNILERFILLCRHMQLVTLVTGKNVFIILLTPYICISHLFFLT